MLFIPDFSATDYRSPFTPAFHGCLFHGISCKCGRSERERFSDRTTNEHPLRINRQPIGPATIAPADRRPRSIPIFGWDASESASYGPEAALAADSSRLLGVRSTSFPSALPSLRGWSSATFSLSPDELLPLHPWRRLYRPRASTRGVSPGLARQRIATDYILTAGRGISAAVGALVLRLPSLPPHTVVSLRGILDRAPPSESARRPKRRCLHGSDLSFCRHAADHHVGVLGASLQRWTSRAGDALPPRRRYRSRRARMSGFAKFSPAVSPR